MNPFIDNFKETEEFVSLTTQAEFKYPELDQPKPKYTEQDYFMQEGIPVVGRLFAPVGADALWSTVGAEEGGEEPPVTGGTEPEPPVTGETGTTEP